MDTDAAPTADTAEQPKMIKKKKVSKSDVPYTAHTAAPAPTDLQRMFEAECELALQAKVQEETNERKNALEAYVYSLRNKLYDVLADYVSEVDKAKIIKTTEDLEEWLYDEGEDQPKSVYVAKLDELKAMGEPIEQRYQVLGWCFGCGGGCGGGNMGCLFKNRPLLNTHNPTKTG